MEQQGNDEKYDEDADRRLARKLAWLTIPLLSVIQILGFIDKFILNYGAVLGLFEDTHLTSQEFGLSGSFFFIGMFITQISNQYFLQSCRIAKYFGAMSICWGVAIGCTALASNFRQLAALRFLVGFFQGSSTVSTYVIIGMFFRRNEQIFWITLMMIFNFIGMAVSGLLGYTIGFMDGLAHLRAWKWLMIIFGPITSICGILVFVFLPDTPRSRWLQLTEEEKELMNSRIRDNGTVKTDKVDFAQIREALSDVRYYYYSLAFFFISMPVACTTQFSSQLIKSMGFSNLNSVLMNVPIAITTMLLVYLGLFLVQRFHQIYYTTMLLSLITLVGVFLLCVLPVGPIQLLGIFLSNPAPIAVILEASVVNNVMGYTKRVFYLGTFMLCYTLGNVVGPIILGSTSAYNHYYPALVAFMAFLGIACCLVLIIRRISLGKNRKREELEQHGQIPPPPDRREDLDWTDEMDLHFRYRL
ncbi:major facilitator superfamily domain-containing protein [Phascolomyces articulosus]|uniref:Major facilitator superfamily domain-containing protein n=1 Tax=Phascolomyces articulosus TaxID=60185 RepID=A0AAD5JQK4_9FUNG|nr:major facilitator superfamily domain-containing protein [Phascolomyces articulosus]